MKEKLHFWYSANLERMKREDPFREIVENFAMISGKEVYYNIANTKNEPGTFHGDEVYLGTGYLYSHNGVIQNEAN